MEHPSPDALLRESLSKKVKDPLKLGLQRNEINIEAQGAEYLGTALAADFIIETSALPCLDTACRPQLAGTSYPWLGHYRCSNIDFKLSMPEGNMIFSDIFHRSNTGHTIHLHSSTKYLRLNVRTNQVLMSIEYNVDSQ
ncbi:hypothetical protein J6590_031895 [Homalodisca vitripennis]|nr:hypothetical protein J6590_031895 [Homalodisca vitripennis]